MNNVTDPRNANECEVICLISPVKSEYYPSHSENQSDTICLLSLTDSPEVYSQQQSTNPIGTSIRSNRNAIENDTMTNKPRQLRGKIAGYGTGLRPELRGSAAMQQLKLHMSAYENPSMMLHIPSLDSTTNYQNPTNITSVTPAMTAATGIGTATTATATAAVAAALPSKRTTRRMNMKIPRSKPPTKYKKPKGEGGRRKSLELSIAGKTDTNLDCKIKNEEGEDDEEFSTLWYWEEDEENLDQYPPQRILTGTNFVAHSKDIASEIDEAYQQYIQQHRHNSSNGTIFVGLDNNNTARTVYEINFQLMEQCNIVVTPRTTKLRRNTEQIPVSITSDEYASIAKIFTYPFNPELDTVTIVTIERIHNPNLLDTYCEKLNTITKRYTTNPHHCINNIPMNTTTHYYNFFPNQPNVIYNTTNKYERRWLFHGTSKANVSKIIHQGFNRSFANPYCTLGNGIYFAAESNNSAGYTDPDMNDIRYIFLCRVAVGDWCDGRPCQIQPDTKPYDPNEAFDSTVDQKRNPSVFVTYHDCQAYPEYLIAFRLYKHDSHPDNDLSLHDDLSLGCTIS